MRVLLQLRGRYPDAVLQGNRTTSTRTLPSEPLPWPSRFSTESSGYVTHGMPPIMRTTEENNTRHSGNRVRAYYDRLRAHLQPSTLPPPFALALLVPSGNVPAIAAAIHCGRVPALAKFSLGVYQRSVTRGIWTPASLASLLMHHASAPA